MRRGIDQALVLVLTMDINEILGKFGELVSGDLSVLNPCEASAILLKNAAKEYGIFGSPVDVFLFEPEPNFLGVFGRKKPGDRAFRSAFANNGTICSCPQQKTKGIDDQRLPRTCLP